MFKNLQKNCNLFLNQGQQIVDVDVHAHVLPFLDNGPSSIEESLDMCDMLANLGFRQCIVTPHIMSTYYENTEKNILDVSLELQARIEEANIPIKLRAAAEYYIDDSFIKKLKSFTPLLTLDDNEYHILIETAFLNEFNFLQYAIERLLVFGYAPVMAHPEKFNYLFEEDKKINILRKMGLKFQVDLDVFLESTIKTKKDNLKIRIGLIPSG